MTYECEKQKEPYILLDVGGTEVKGAISDRSGNIIGGIRYFPAYSDRDKIAILDNFAHIIKEIMTQGGIKAPTAIGIAIPGPFDYEKGISRMMGLGKYESIYGVSIIDELKARMEGLKDTQFCFLHDVEAFAIGESWFGEVKDVTKVLCLCIGTGAGSAFMKDRLPLKEKQDGVPLSGWIYNTPYKKTILDDYLSVRGLKKISLKVTGNAYTGKELYELCRLEQEGALEVYRLFGEDLKAGITPFLDAFKPDAIVLGGQITKSFAYFGNAFQRECEERNIMVYLEKETSKRAMQGLAKTIERRWEDAKS